MAEIETMDMDTKNQHFDRDLGKIIAFLEESAYFKARDLLLEYNSVDIAEMLEDVLEDLGIVLGKAFYELTRGQALSRFGTAFIPMDEALSRCVLDISGRPYLVFDATFSSPYIGAMETCMFREFFYAFAIHAAVTLHLSVLYGDNDHHKAESLCKAFAYALRQACAPVSGAVLSTKGTLEK